MPLSIVVSARVTPEVYEGLTRFIRKGETIADVLRRFIDEGLARYATPEDAKP